MRSLALALVLGMSLVASHGVSHAEAQPAAGWELRIPERVELVAGAGGALPIVIAVDRGLAISKDAAVILDLAPDGAIAVKRRRLGRSDAVDPGADAPRFAVALRADSAGELGVRVRLRFWLCGAKVCRPVDTRRNVAISVVAPPTPSPAPAPSPSLPSR